MNPPESREPGAWTASPSIALELDMALSVLNGHYPTGSMPPEIAAAVDGAAAGWEAQWAGVLAEPGRDVDLLETMAILADVLLEGGYSRATLGMRELTLGSSLAALERDAAVAGLPVDLALAPEARLTSLAVRHQVQLFEKLGLSPDRTEGLALRWERDIRAVVRVLAGGDLHARFWHWLDRFYYEQYGPWRRTRAGILAEAERRLRTVMGGETGATTHPSTGWLPRQSPLLRLPELRAGFEAEQLQLVCWIEPFGLADAWLLYRPVGREGPTLLVMACAEPGQIYENFRVTAADIAARAAALGDPTRLIILRLIRHFGMVNTEIAEYLGMARPTVSIHAKVLRDAGLIRSRQEGRLVRHEIDAEAVRGLFEDLERFLDLPPELAP